ncbi:MAG TPA: lysophospholipid acyltransferase family protein [Dissulfurispiraceae bacterium]|nr:lysophospholipid acyltransferase family protein [Dissulfurispiraceae bacterium]
MKRLLWLLEAVIVIVLSFPLAVLPYKCALRAGGFLGLLVFYAWAGRRSIAVENIERAIRAGALGGSSHEVAAPAAKASKIARESFINLGKSLAEVVRIYYGFGDSLIHNVVIKGEEHYIKAKEKGKGILFVTGHCGNWELGALAFGVKLSPVSFIARAQDNPYINGMIGKVRARYGNRVIYKKGALKGILACLKKEGTVGLLMDQAVVRDEGFIINFLGRGAWTTKIPVLIAGKTGVPVIPVFISREATGHVITIYPEVSLNREEMSESALKEDTQRLSSYVDDYIKEHPAEWLWIHRRWKRVEGNDDRPGGMGPG